MDVPKDLRIQTYHWRILPDGTESALPENRSSALPKGGRTIVHLIDAQGKYVATGIAVCSSEDQYVRKLGYQKALGRALSALKKPKEVIGLPTDYEDEQLRKDLAIYFDGASNRNDYDAARQRLLAFAKGGKEVTQSKEA